MTDPTGSTSRSAQGTRLNRRGVESRRRFIEAAIETLATEGPGGASANRVARRAGVTWGTVQHQFGDADGVWAAVIAELAHRVRLMDAAPAGGAVSIRRRVQVLVEHLWAGYGSREARAVESLRFALPRDRDALAVEFPRTDGALRSFDEEWAAILLRQFADLPVSSARRRRVRSLLPGALRGLRIESEMPGYTDAGEGVRALVDVVVAYLEAGSTDR